MKLKAQNVMEIITMVALVGIVVVTAFMFMNGNNSKLANLSSINTNKSSTSVTSSLKSQTSTNTITTADTETAGALSSILAHSDKTGLAQTLASLTVEDVLLVKTNDNENVFDLADKLIDTHSLPISPFNGEYAFNDDSKLRLKDVAVKTNEKLTQTQATSTTFESYIYLLKQILKI